MSINIKKGDTFTFEYDLEWNDGSPIDLTMVDPVYMYATIYDDKTPYMSIACTVTDADDGRVEVDFDDDDTETVGMYEIIFKCNFPNDETLSVPMNGKMWLHIEDGYMVS